MKDNIPNLFIVGAAKAGTTSLYTYLSQHSKIFMCPIKEPHFFGQDIQWKNFDNRYKRNTYLNIDAYLRVRPLKPKHLGYISNENDYKNLFSDVTDQLIIGDASTSYLYSKYAAEEIYQFNPNAKIIIILRDPVDRALSHYFMDLSGRNQSEKDILKGMKADFEAAEKGWGISHLYIELGMYCEQIMRYLNIFPSEQILILRFEDLRQNVENMSRQITQFLSIESSLEMKTNEVHNETLIPKNNLIKKAKALKNIFPEVTREWLKKNSGFLFKTTQRMDVKPEVTQYLESLLSDNWKETKKLINNTL